MELITIDIKSDRQTVSEAIAQFLLEVGRSDQSKFPKKM